MIVQTATLPCDPCVRRAWLLGALAGHLEQAWKARRPLRDVLALDDHTLIRSLGGTRTTALLNDHEHLDVDALRERWSAAPVTAVCAHDPRYPERLRTGPDAPAVLFCAGDPDRLHGWLGGDVGEGPPAAAVVGTRRPLPEAEELARTLGRGLAAAGVTVVSGMAMGIDAAAHVGALDVGGPTVAVLACGPERAYPRSVTRTHTRLLESQLVVSELHPGLSPWRWAFPARNRIIAALGRAAIVVEAAERSGSLITADFAADLGRDIGSVPGRAGSDRTRGSNRLLAQGAAVILDAADALDLVLGATRPRPAHPAPPRIDAALQRLLAAVADGMSPTSTAGSPEAADRARVGLMELELLGLVRRLPGGEHVVVR